jgi:hypothetical protein
MVPISIGLCKPFHFGIPAISRVFGQFIFNITLVSYHNVGYYYSVLPS